MYNQHQLQQQQQPQASIDQYELQMVEQMSAAEQQRENSNTRSNVSGEGGGALSSKKARIQAISKKYAIRQDQQDLRKQRHSPVGGDIAHATDLHRQNSYNNFKNKRNQSFAKSQIKQNNDKDSNSMNLNESNQNNSKILIQQEESSRDSAQQQDYSAGNYRTNKQNMAKSKQGRVDLRKERSASDRNARQGGVGATHGNPRDASETLSTGRAIDKEGISNQLNRDRQSHSGNSKGNTYTTTIDQNQHFPSKFKYSFGAGTPASQKGQDQSKVQQLQTQVSDSQAYSQRSGTPRVKKHAGDQGYSKKLAKPGVQANPRDKKQQTFGSINLDGDQGSKKTRSNTEIFHELLIRSCKIQEKIQETLMVSNVKKQKQIEKAYSRNERKEALNLSKQLHDLSTYPAVSQKSKSFKEIADGLLRQLEFLDGQGFFLREPPGGSERSTARPVGILKNNRSGSRGSSDEQMRSGDASQLQRPRSQPGGSHFNLKDQSKEARTNKKTIKLSELQEIKQQDDIIGKLQRERDYYKSLNQGLQDQLKTLNDNYSLERKKFMDEIDNQHQEMQAHFQEMQKEYTERLRDQKGQFDSELANKNQDLQDQVQQIIECQKEMKKLKFVREKSRGNITDGDRLSGYLELGQKNVSEMVAELEYYKDTVQGLETENKTLDLELQYYRKQNQQHQLLQDQITQLETENQNTKNQLENLTSEKYFFEKEYNIQKSQLQALQQRTTGEDPTRFEVDPVNLRNGERHENYGSNGTPEPRKKSPVPTMATGSEYGATLSNEITMKNKRYATIRSKSGSQKRRQMPPSHLSNQDFARSLSSENAGCRRLGFLRSIKPRDDAQRMSDQKKTIQSQAKMIEKLLLKVKKLKNEHVKMDLDIFAIDRQTECEQFENQQSMAQLELKTYKDNIQELYDILLKQNQNKIEKNNITNDHNEQFIQIKCFLNMQLSLGAMQKFRFDHNFFSLFDLSNVQRLIDSYHQSRNGKVFMNTDQIQKQNLEIFNELKDLCFQNIGQFFIIYEQMVYNKSKNEELERGYEYLNRAVAALDGRMQDQSTIQDSQIEQEKQIIVELQKENHIQQQKILDLISKIEVYRAESDIKPHHMLIILQKITSNSQIDDSSNEFMKQNELHQSMTSDKAKTKKGSKDGRESSLQRSSNLQQRGRSLGSSKPPQSRKTTVFGNKKPWLNNKTGDPDLNEALDRIEKLQQEYEESDKERQLYQCESQKLQKDVNMLTEQLEKLTHAHNQLENVKIDFEEKLAKHVKRVKELEYECEDQRCRIERLTGLNQEMRDLIDQERQYNNDEIRRVEEEGTTKIKQIESKNKLSKNKLLQLANHWRVFVAPSFEIEQILDSMLDYAANNKLGSSGQIRLGPASYQNQKNRPPNRSEERKSPIRSSTIENDNIKNQENIQQVRLKSKDKTDNNYPGHRGSREPAPNNRSLSNEIIHNGQRYMKVRSRGNTPEERNPPPKEDQRQPRFEESFQGNQSSLQRNNNNDSLQPTIVTKENSRSKTRINRLYEDYERDAQDFENIQKKSANQQRTNIPHDSRLENEARVQINQDRMEQDRADQDIETRMHQQNQKKKGDANRNQIIQAQNFNVANHPSQIWPTTQQQQDKRIISYDANKQKPPSFLKTIDSDQSSFNQMQQQNPAHLQAYHQRSSQNIKFADQLAQSKYLSDLPKQMAAEEAQLQFQSHQLYPSISVNNENKDDLAIQPQNPQINHNPGNFNSGVNSLLQNKSFQSQNQPSTQLEKERQDFNEKLTRLKQRLNAGSNMGSFGGGELVLNVASLSNRDGLFGGGGPQNFTTRGGAPAGDTYISQDLSQRNQIQHSRSSSFLKLPMQSPIKMNGIATPTNNDQLEQSINKRLKEFEEEQLMRQQNRSQQDGRMVAGRMIIS